MEERKENLRVGVCGKSKILVESAANLDYVEEDVQGFLIPEHPDGKFNPPSARKINILPIVAANRFLPAHLRSTGTSVDIIGLEHYIKNAFKRACQVGIKIIVFGSSGSREVEKGYSKSRAEQEFVNILKLMGPLANDHSVTVVVEPLNSEECNIINTLTEGAEAVRAASHPNVKLVADLYHMLRENENPDAIIKAGNLIRHVHVAEEANRTPPGVYGDDFRPFLGSLNKISYQGNFSIESRWEDLLMQVGPAVTELRRQLADVN